MIKNTIRIIYRVITRGWLEVKRNYPCATCKRWYCTVSHLEVDRTS